MIKCTKQGVFIKNGNETAPSVPKEEALKNTLAYQIMQSHAQTDGDLFKIKFDALASHDITYVGVIQTVRAANPGFDKFPIPYVLTNCHNSLCAVGGTTNEDDHIFGLSAAKKYGGIFVPPHIAVIHQYMREVFAGCGKMLLGSDSHTRYGALGTMGIGEGGGGLVKQILGKTYDIPRPEVIGVRLSGCPRPGVGPQDVALALIGKVFHDGFVKNKVLEFFGSGVANLSVEYRIGIDVMTTETACLSSIWTTDSQVEEFFALHGRPEAYKPLSIEGEAYYDGLINIDLSAVVPMIALPYHPSNVYTIEELQKNPKDILSSIEGLDVKNLCTPEGIRVDQGIIAGCAGGLYESICEATALLGQDTMLNDAFSLSVYPASQPMYLTLVENGVAANLLRAGAVIKTAFCGPCFGAGDVPKNNGLSIRHVTRNFPNREGAKPSLGQSASVALMDALSIAATAKNGGILTTATSIMESKPQIPKYFFDHKPYTNRIYNGFGKNDPATELIYGPGIRDWPKLAPLADDILLEVASFITDPVTTTDELIPSGETSTFRSNPYALAEHTLSRKDPGYVARAKKIAAYTTSDMTQAIDKILKSGQKIDKPAIGSLIYANRPGDGSAREQAASCQRVLGGMANIAIEYATKRYRSNLINWGMLPLLLGKGPGEALAHDSQPAFKVHDIIFLSNIREVVKNLGGQVNAYIIPADGGQIHPLPLHLAPLTPDEADILLAGCLINYYGGKS
ncbi:MAG: hydratase [Defluviitaleaceae bacterium]|nr:hydratase [Defluviitaleaceae bacterium]